MRRALATGFIVLFGTLLLIGLSGELVLAQEGSISGYVYEEDGVTPVAGACLWVDPGEPGLGDEWPYCSTDVNGSFTIPGVYSGTYYLSTSADGLGNNPNLIDEWYTPDGGTEDPALATPIQVVSGSTTSGITFTLKVGGSISGYVYEEDGVTPVEGACLWVDPEQPWSQDRWPYCNTAVDGSFTIPGVYSGTYYLSTSANGLGRNPNLIDEWYAPDGGTEDPTPIQVVTGSTTSDITFTLKVAGSISGHVYQEDGITPVEGACLWVDPDEPWPEDRWSYCDTAADGGFTIPGIYSGTYYLSTWANGLGRNPHLIDEWYTPGGGTEDPALATPIQVVTGSTTSGITFTLARAESVGSVTPEQGGTISLTHAVTITVSFPPDAVSWPITVSLQITTQRPVSSGFKILGHVFSIEARTTGGTLLTTFSRPFTITIHYRDIDVIDLNEAELKLYSRDDDEGWWHAISSLVDMGANTISAALDHLSSFAILGKIEHRVYLPVVLRGQ